jgi:hypothetical protein
MAIGKMTAALRARGEKVRDATVRGLAKASKQGTRQIFARSRELRRFSMGGAFLGVGVVLLLAFIYDKLRARAQRHYLFVDRNFDTAARAWKRRPDRQRRLLRQHFWPIYQMAIHARDIHPPYTDEASFLELAGRAIDSDMPLLEGRTAAGEPSRIPFRQAQKLFASPPFCIHKNSVNDLRFSWFREVRDRHLGWKRALLDLTQSAPFENFMLLGFRRDLITMFSRGLRRATSGVRLEDLVGTSDPELIPREVIEDRDRIRAYTARKLIRGDSRDRVWQVLVDGLANVVREVSRADPELLTGECLREGADGTWSAEPGSHALLQNLQSLEASFGGDRRRPGWNREKLTRHADRARNLTHRLLDFCRTHDPDRLQVRDLGDLRAVRVAVQLDRRLRRRLENGHAPADLLAAFGDIARSQALYDRALIELRGVYAGSFADFKCYHEFLDEVLVPYRDRHPEADFDPWHAKVFPVLAAFIRQAWRSLRQRLQSN